MQHEMTGRPSTDRTPGRDNPKVFSSTPTRQSRKQLTDLLPLARELYLRKVAK